MAIPNLAGKRVPTGSTATALRRQVGSVLAPFGFHGLRSIGSQVMCGVGGGAPVALVVTLTGCDRSLGERAPGRSSARTERRQLHLLFGAGASRAATTESSCRRKEVDVQVSCQAMERLSCPIADPGLPTASDRGPAEPLAESRRVSSKYSHDYRNHIELKLLPASPWRRPDAAGDCRLAIDILKRSAASTAVSELERRYRCKNGRNGVCY